MSDDNVFNVKVKYTREKASAQFGDMAPEEFELLVKSIKEDGQMEPIIVKGKEIVDGWHRYRACLEAGETPYMWEYDPSVDGELQSFVIKKNLLRRQLPPAERVKQAIKLLGYEPKNGLNKKGGAGATAADVAAVAGVSTKTVNRMVKSDGTRVPPDKPKLSKDKVLISELKAELSAAKQEIAELKAEVKRLTPRPNPLKGMRTRN